MSYGITYCSVCDHPTVQAGGTWYHADSETPICTGASNVYTQRNPQKESRDEHRE